MSPRQKVREVVTRMFGEDIGCGDGGCIYGCKPGMHTNGGCRCGNGERYEMRADILRLSALAMELAKEAKKL